jgi:hypothetical protein
MMGRSRFLSFVRVSDYRSAWLDSPYNLLGKCVVTALPSGMAENRRRKRMWPFDQNNQQMYQQYAQAYNSQNYNGIDPNQAIGHVQQFAQNAPPEFQQQVYQQHFEQMPYEQRAQFAQQMPPQYAMSPNNPQGMAQGFYQMGQQQPGMLPRVFGQGQGGGGMLGNPLVSGGLGALVGLAASSILGQQGGGLFGGREGYDRDDNEGYGRRDDDDRGFFQRDNDEGYGRRDDDDRGFF